MIVPYRRVKVTQGLAVMMSNHFFYTDFGVRESSDESAYGRRYLCDGTPGTGFIERSSESHSYHEFVRDRVADQHPTYWKLLFNREPNYEREQNRARAALAAATDPVKRQILDCYVNALAVGRVEERVERIIRAIKDKMGHHHNKFMVSVISHHKHKIRQLEHDMKSVQFDVKNMCSPEVYAAWLEVVEAFRKVANCRRTWHHNEAKSTRYQQVFFDFGIFDFIHADTFLPLMRDSNGVQYYLLPTCLIAARSSVDFDVHPLKDLAFVCQEMAIEETVETLTSYLGDAASMLRIPELGQTWYFNHVTPIMHFVGAYDHLRSLQ